MKGLRQKPDKPSIHLFFITCLKKLMTNFVIIIIKLTLK